MKLLVVSWGDFNRWKEIRYRFGDETSVGPSTLPILQKVIRPDWTAVVLSDTLGKEFSSLKALRDDVRTSVMKFLDRIGAGREVDTIIAPGIGEFRHGTFRGNAMDAYNYILRRLAEIIPADAPLDVHFDSTHGLNYITLLTYRALKDLLGIATLRNRVHFAAYNSDPFVPKVSRELTLHKIENTPVTPSPLAEPLPSSAKDYIGRFSVPGGEYGQVIKGLKRLKEIRTRVRRLNSWIASILNGLPLVFASAFPDETELNEAVEEIEDVYKENVAVSPTTVERRISLGEGFGRLVKLTFQIRVLKREGLPKEELSIEELKNLSEEVFRGRVLASTKTEIDRIARSLKADTNDWLRYSEILRMMGKSPNPQVDDRNFLAHAGLETNLIEVKREGELYVRYTRDKVKYGGEMKNPWKVIENILKNTLRGD